MKLIDAGVNLMNPSYDQDREEVVKAAMAAGVSPLVITGSSERSSLNAALYASSYNAGRPGALYTTAGIHPHEAKNCGNGTIEFLRDLFREKSEQNPDEQRFGIKAIGECGLDYNRDFSPRYLQRRWFVKQAELAAELSLPLFLHERDAFEDLSAILKNFISKVPAAVIHCFTGSEKELDSYLDLGCHIGITGWICDERRGQHLQTLVKKIPADRLMLETDAPFLIPRDLKKARRNEPKYLPHIAETIARHQGKDPVLLAQETYTNTLKFFEIE